MTQSDTAKSSIGTRADPPRPRYSAATPMQVSTAYGPVRGRQESNGAIAFLGIPFAKPPVDALRGCAPQAPDPWTDVRDCTRFGSHAVQQSYPPKAGEVDGSEDCLFLNVWVPPVVSDKPRAVMLWFHGGAFVFGTGSDNLYNGASYAANHDLIFITSNYRLGGFGYFRNNRDPASQNLGILDQIEALRWIKKTIASFGGDPDNVTIMGESAGAMSCGMLAGAPAAKGLITRAIIQSGGVRPIFTGDEPAQLQKMVLAAAGLKEDEVDRFYTLSTQQMNDAFTAVSGQSGTALFGGEAFRPSVDGHVFPQHPFESLNPIPMLIGHCEAEIGFFKWANAETLLKGLPAKLKALMGDALWDRLEKAYQAHPVQDASWSDDLWSDCFVGINAFRLGDVLRAKGVDAWSYRFNWRGAFEAGAIHTADIPFTFNAPGKTFAGNAHLWGDAEHNLGRMMQESFANFAKTGDPSASGLPHWPMHDAEGTHMSFDLAPSVRKHIISAPRKAAWADVPLTVV